MRSSSQENYSDNVSFEKLLFNNQAFRKKNWEVLHDNEKHRLIFQWIEGQEKIKYSSEELSQNLGPLKIGFGLLNKYANYRNSTLDIDRLKNKFCDKRRKILHESIKKLLENNTKWLAYWK